MSAENIIRHLRVLWRTNRIIADIRLKHLLLSLLLQAFAALVAVFGLSLLELAAYSALVQFWNTILSAAVLGLINFAIAAILLVLAARRPPSRELALASEVHNSAMEALQLEVRTLRHPWESAALSMLPGLIPLLVRWLKRQDPKQTANSG